MRHTGANHRRKGSLLAAILLFIVGILSVIIYLGYKSYKERYYINLYDEKTIDRVIDVPPFTERQTEANKELIGECDLLIGTTFAQATDFYASFCKARGFGFEPKGNSFSMVIRKGYIVVGTKNNSVLELRWYPNLNAKQASKCRKLFGQVKMQPEED